MLVGGTSLHQLTFDAIEALRAASSPEMMLEQVASSGILWKRSAVILAEAYA